MKPERVDRILFFVNLWRRASLGYPIRVNQVGGVKRSWEREAVVEDGCQSAMTMETKKDLANFG
jgi:hypothetical protein